MDEDARVLNFDRDRPRREHARRRTRSDHPANHLRLVDGDGAGAVIALPRDPDDVA